MSGSTSAEPLPPGFGIARVEETGTASHELIYEFEYFPKPIRKFDPYEPSGSLFLRPAVRKGKAPFQFWGNRVPMSADHARCWLGHVLLQEVANEKLALVEFIVRTEKELRHISADGAGTVGMGGAQRHAPHPDWLWHIWPKGSDVGVQNRSPVTELHMRMNANKGIIIELRGEWEGALASIYRVLHQYCDDDEGDSHWRPTPAPPMQITKVKARDHAETVRRNRLLGQQAPDHGLRMLHGTIDQWGEAERSLVRAVERAKAASKTADLSTAPQCCSELRDALTKAMEQRLRLRPEWSVTTAQAIETFLQRLLEASAIGSTEGSETSDALTSVLADTVELTVAICGLGIHPPECLETAQLQLRSSTVPPALADGATA
mmetsp:Transcript_54044/g.94284  ORF Transcript_54044/g.94284 Transcript_54044/m.94284 type:complete len:377 (-) Transcript_54044:34-1164(-)